ncbi:kynurenine formamidase-like [Hydractinia symbiolongicarpus]|uniref:kynurenine formamidase-like n=1 Tax=Hydractinia symbiolongicarpus TaxID=13093 RepID=UPI00254F8DCD|nr:kynurenine formamidase-like [Hydractinia symbiolongicarpus]
MSNDWYEKQYNPSFWSKRYATREEVIQNFIDVATKRSEKTRRNITSELDISYGTSKRQRIDIFYPDENKNEKPKDSIIVYIHGGYWQEGDKSLYSFAAKQFVCNGFAFVVIGYDLTPEVTIPQIIEQIETALIVIKDKFKSTKLILLGHSAGAHASVAVADRGNVSVDALFLVSGVYDLLPLINTSINDTLRLSKESAACLNLMKPIKGVNIIFVCIGENDSPEFYRQSKVFSQKQSSETLSGFYTVDNEDHFSIILSMYDENAMLTKEILKAAKILVKK